MFETIYSDKSAGFFKCVIIGATGSEFYIQLFKKKESKIYGIEISI